MLKNFPESRLLIPAWADTLNPEQRRRALTRTILRLAAIHFTPAGRMKTLSEYIGYHHDSLNSVFFQPNGVSKKLCCQLEDILGRECFPREAFNPRHYPSDLEPIDE